MVGQRRKKSGAICGPGDFTDNSNVTDALLLNGRLLNVQGYVVKNK